MLVVFYGNVVFPDYFPKGYPLKVVNFEKFTSSKDMLEAVSDPKSVILVENAYKLKIYYEYYVSRAISNSTEKIVVLSELRFDYFREVKRAMAAFFAKLSKLPNPVIFSFPLGERENNVYNRIYPVGYDDFSLFGGNFQMIVPFTEIDGDLVTMTSLTLNRGAKFKQFNEYLNFFLTLLPKQESLPEGDVSGTK